MIPARFGTESLQDARIQRILAAAIDAVEPGKRVREALHHIPKVPGWVYAIGIGKAAQPMTEALAAHFPLRDALVITKRATGDSRKGLRILEAGHPVPDERSIAAGQAALEFAARLHPDDLLVCLISGGGSALACAPVDGIGLRDLQRLNAALLASGASIEQVNSIRRHVDTIKGGGLAASTRAQVVGLILSDVIGDPIEVVASGPTATNPIGTEDPMALLERLSVESPPAIARAAATNYKSRSGMETGRVRNFLIGDIRTAARGALHQAMQEGFRASLLDLRIQGEARQIGMEMGQRLATAAGGRAKRPFCMIAGGETTVTVTGTGRGGRNQELALAAVEALAGSVNVMLVALASDGEDGPTEAAGAVATGDTLERGRRLGLLPGEFLEANNAFAYFDSLGDLLRPGPTDTNVADLALLIGR
jgi:hydroxypyruvate reductase